MGEPVRRENHKKAQNESGHGQRDVYANDVLLIADPTDRGFAAGAGSGSAAVEPLDMENVVRKLIALLSEQSE